MTALDENWKKRAACTGKPYDWFYTDPQGDYGRGRAVCTHCPVQSDCLTYALEIGDEQGLWGGMSPTQRDRIRRGLKVRALS